jgi:hypothetical protein
MAMVLQSSFAKRAAAWMVALAVISTFAALCGRAAGGTLRELSPAEQSARLGRVWEACNSVEHCGEKNGGSKTCLGLIVDGVCRPLASECIPDPACSVSASAKRCGFAWFDECQRIAPQSPIDCGFERIGDCVSAGAVCECRARKVNRNRRCAPIAADECR